MLRKGYSTSTPIWESLRFGRGRRRFSDLIRTALDISFIRSKLNASSHIHRDGGLLQRYMPMLQMGAPYNTSKKYLRELLFVWEEGILCTHQSSLDISFTWSKLKVRFRILRVGDLLPCWHANATKGHDKLHRAWYRSPFFLLGKKIFLKLLYDCLGSLIYGHSKLSHSPRLRSAPIQNSKTLHFTNTRNTVFKEAWRVCCALVLWLWETRPYESTSLYRQ